MKVMQVSKKLRKFPGKRMKKLRQMAEQPARMAEQLTAGNHKNLPFPTKDIEEKVV